VRVCYGLHVTATEPLPSIGRVYRAVPDIITNIPKIKSDINENSQKEIIHILEIVMEQNYFQFEQKYYKQTHGPAMAAPTPAILAEAYIQNMEHKYTQY
jgi:hypothetical protein